MLTPIIIIALFGGLFRRRWFYRPMGGMFWGGPWMMRRPPMGHMGMHGPMGGFGGPHMGGGFGGPMGGHGMGRHGR